MLSTVMTLNVAWGYLVQKSNGPQNFAEWSLLNVARRAVSNAEHFLVGR